MRTFTIVAIIAAGAAGIIVWSAFSYSPATGFIGTLDWGMDQKNDGEQGSIVNGTNSTTSTSIGYPQVNVTIGGVKLVADIAESSDQRSKGLSIKNTLAENEAMLFVFGEAREHSFWMKNMKFPIDIIWISEFHEVTHIEHSLEPCIPDEFCPTYKPDRNSLYVLETVAGFAQRHNVTENAYVDFELDS